MRNINVYVIDPFTRTVTDETMDADNFKEFYRLIGAEPFDMVHISNGNCFVVDDNGFFRERKAFFRCSWLPYPLVNRAVFCRHDRHGNTQPPRITKAALIATLTWPDQVTQPATTITTFGEDGTPKTDVITPAKDHKRTD